MKTRPTAGTGREGGSRVKIESTKEAIVPAAQKYCFRKTKIQTLAPNGRYVPKKRILCIEKETRGPDKNFYFSYRKRIHGGLAWSKDLGMLRQKAYFHAGINLTAKLSMPLLEKNRCEGTVSDSID